MSPCLLLLGVFDFCVPYHFPQLGLVVEFRAFVVVFRLGLALWLWLLYSIKAMRKLNSKVLIAFNACMLDHTGSARKEAANDEHQVVVENIERRFVAQARPEDANPRLIAGDARPEPESTNPSTLNHSDGPFERASQLI